MNIKPFIFYSVIASTTLLYGCGGTEQTADSSTEQSTDSSSTITSTGLVINEIVASPSDTTYDWIELYATEDIADLSVFSLVDDNADREPQALPAVSLSQGEFIVIQAIDETDTPPDNGYYVTFKLGSDDAVTLYEDGTAISVLDWEEGEAAEGFSYGLYTDGTGTAQTLTPTEGAANQTADTSTLVTTLIAEDAPLRIDSKIDKHVRRVWSLNRQRGKKDVDKTKGMKNDFPLTLKRDASREQLLGWDGALTLLGEICETATAKIDNDWGIYGPPRSIRGSGHVKIPNASIASRHGEKGCIDLYGRSNSSDSIRSSLAVPKLSSDRPKKLIGKELRQALKKKLGKNQLSVAYVDGIKNVEGLGLSMQYFLGGRDVIKKMTELDVANRKRNGGR